MTRLHCEPLMRAKDLWGTFIVQIGISTRHGRLSDASQARIAAKGEKLLKIFDRLTAIEFIVDLTDSNLPRVDLKVSAEHKHDFVAHHQSDDLMGSVDAVVHRLEQQLRKYKERVVERHRDGEARRRETGAKPEQERQEQDLTQRRSERRETGQNN